MNVKLRGVHFYCKPVLSAGGPNCTQIGHVFLILFFKAPNVLTLCRLLKYVLQIILFSKLKKYDKIRLETKLSVKQVQW